MNSPANCIALWKCTQMWAADSRKWEPEAWKPKVRTWKKLETQKWKLDRDITVHFIWYKSERQKIWLLFWKKSHSVEFLCLYYHLLSGCHEDEGSIEEMISNWFQKFDLYFEDNANCDPEHVLNGNRRSRYEQFHSIHSNYARKKTKLLKTFARA